MWRRRRREHVVCHTMRHWLGGWRHEHMCGCLCRGMRECGERRGSRSSLGGASMVICLRGECIRLRALTASVPSQIRIFILAFPHVRGTDAAVIYPMLLGEIGGQ